MLPQCVAWNSPVIPAATSSMTAPQIVGNAVRPNASDGSLSRGETTTPADHDNEPNTGNGRPDPCRNQRRNCFDRIADREIRRSPNDIDRHESQRQLDGVTPVLHGRGFTWLRDDHGSASNIYHLAAPKEGSDLRRLVERHDLNL